MTREQELQTAIESLRLELWNLQNEHFERRMEEHLGKYFKYRNSYSAPCSDKDYWWIYGKLIRTMNKNCIMLTFQIDCNGQIIIEAEDSTSCPEPNSGWEEISLKEWNEAVQTLLKRINTIFDQQ